MTPVCRHDPTRNASNPAWLSRGTASHDPDFGEKRQQGRKTPSCCDASTSSWSSAINSGGPTSRDASVPGFDLEEKRQQLRKMIVRLEGHNSVLRCS
ncbi:hypothetical protein PUNSTDRAFT_136918 [Punctularia strigosozonata HHB-11173 SS5]|uniref:uncharacterized protein n=1 Tax=Punctularia strigosozonata (strain HHB-11173) TaxID=741275 RepID=UPI0004416A7D|nr:uncharacterized protein PUNSTDRAFT_136918 [Punctularia strigosozonata HHB-11173 SS5]EIN06127.1 hypothetical protein PUNSTDRAFT_136918 [Punctularia strigosozonata HHB-11173 SS5]